MTVQGTGIHSVSQNNCKYKVFIAFLYTNEFCNFQLCT